MTFRLCPQEADSPVGEAITSQKLKSVQSGPQNKWALRTLASGRLGDDALKEFSKNFYGPAKAWGRMLGEKAMSAKAWEGCGKALLI